MSGVAPQAERKRMAAPPPEGPEPAGEVPVTVIEPRTGWRALDLRDVWRYRELLFFFTWRDVKVKYKQTVLGAAWAVLQPLATLLIFTVVFGRLVGLDRQTGGIPYPVFVFAGLLPWNLFASAINGSANSVAVNQTLIDKIAFPRILIPVSAVGTNLLDFAVGFVVFIGVMLWCGVAPGPQILLLPLLIALVVMAALAVGVIVSALSVRYRDFRYVLPFAVNTLMYLTPIIYPVTIVPERFRWLLAFNPMVGLVEAFRYCLVGQPADPLHVGTAAAVTVVGLAVSVFCFRRMESTFADII